MTVGPIFSLELGFVTMYIYHFRDEKMTKMTDKEVIEALQSDTLLNKVRRMLFGFAGTAEQAAMQRFPPSPIEMRRQEFEMAAKIIELVKSENH